MRVYFHTPLPPTRTGIADYSAELLPHLAQRCEIILVENDYAEAGREGGFVEALGLRSVTGAEWADDDDVRAVNVYQIGNNHMHLGILKRAIRRPGIAVIHDASIMGLLMGSGAELLTRFTEYELGPQAAEWLASRMAFRQYDWQDFLVRNLGLLVDVSTAVLVHSRYARALVARRYNPGPMQVVQHHLALDFQSGEGSEVDDTPTAAFLARHPTAIVVGTFGFLTPPKRIDWLVEGFRQALDNDIDVILLLAGEPHVAARIDALLSGLPRDRVHITGFLSEDNMRALMARVDLQVTLRFPSVGESSGTLIRAMGIGAPCVILDYEAFSDIPDHHARKLRLDGEVGTALGRIIAEYDRDPRRLRAMGQAARQWACTSATIDHSVDCYVAAIADAAGQTDLPSDLARDISSDLLALMPNALVIEGTTFETVCERMSEKLYQAPALRAIAEATRSDLICPGQLTADVAAFATTAVGRGVRRIVVFVDSVEATAADLIGAVERLCLRRFDVVCILSLSMLLSGAPPNRFRWRDQVVGHGALSGALVHRGSKKVKASLLEPGKSRRIDVANDRSWKADVSVFEVIGP